MEFKRGNWKGGKALFEEIFQVYGSDSQKYLFFGEVGSLLKAISQFERATGISNMKNRRSEIANCIGNVEIMLNQLRLIYDIDDAEVNSCIESRLAKMDYELQQRIYNADRRLNDVIGF